MALSSPTLLWTITSLSRVSGDMLALVGRQWLPAVLKILSLLLLATGMQKSTLTW